MNRVIACPNCRRQYQVKGDPTGKSLKCSQCHRMFTVGASPQTVGNAAPPAPRQIDVPETSQSKLFPDPATMPAHDPLANHVVQDPGFVDVDLDEIRRKRVATERTSKKYEADDPLAKFNREQREKKEEQAALAAKSKLGIKIGIGGAIFYVIFLVTSGILANSYEWGFWMLVGAGAFAGLLGFMVDMMLIQHIKENDPEQYAYYAFLPPYRIYYWVVHWQELMGYVVIELIVGIPLIVNGWLIWYFDDKWGMGWFDF